MSAYEAFLKANNYEGGDEYLFADSSSWESAWAALDEWFGLIPALSQAGGIKALSTTLSVLARCVYYAGYKRGKQESPPFLLPKED